MNRLTLIGGEGPPDFNTEPYPIDVRVEFGAHAQDDEVESLIEGVARGELDFEAWPPSVRHRLNDYDPAMLALDGMQSLSWLHDEGDNKTTGGYLKRALMGILPGKPQDINHSDELLVLAGDASLKPSGILHSGELFIRAGINAVAGSAIFTGGAKAAMAVKDTLGHRSGSGDDEKPRSKASDMSRRSFLRVMGMSGALAGIGGTMMSWGLINDLADTDSHRLQAAARDIEKVVDDSEFISEFSGADTYVDGRTALLIAKVRGAYGQVPGLLGNQSAVVMGTAHMSRAEEFQVSPAARQAAMQELYGSYTARIANGFDQMFGDTVTERMTVMTGVFVMSSIYKYHQPDERDFYNNPDRALHRTVELVDCFIDDEVANAVADQAGPYLGYFENYQFPG